MQFSRLYSMIDNTVFPGYNLDKSFLKERMGKEAAMTILLEKAITRTVDLPPDKQGHLAEIILDALDDMEWDHKFAASQDFLEALADEGLADFEAGRTRKLKV